MHCAMLVVVHSHWPSQGSLFTLQLAAIPSGADRRGGAVFRWSDNQLTYLAVNLVTGLTSTQTVKLVGCVGCASSFLVPAPRWAENAFSSILQSCTASTLNDFRVSTMEHSCFIKPSWFPFEWSSMGDKTRASSDCLGPKALDDAILGRLGMLRWQTNCGHSALLGVPPSRCADP